MRFISHRGNLFGKIFGENNPDSINEVILKGFDCEIDIWKIGSRLFLGHDKPEHYIFPYWLEDRIDTLLLHCKNLEALVYFYETNLHIPNNEWKFHYFYHQNDNFTLTNLNYIVCFPGQPVTPYTIVMKPELYTLNQIKDCYGICSDYISDFQFLLNPIANKKVDQ